MSRRGSSKAPLVSDDAAASSEAPIVPPISLLEVQDLIASNSTSTIATALSNFETSFNATWSARLDETSKRLETQPAVNVSALSYY